MNLLRAGSRRYFSFGHNFPIVASYYYKGKEFINDWDLQEYPEAVQVFLTKRWTSKREIPPKVRTLDPGKYPPDWFQSNTALQKLVPIDVLYEPGLLHKVEANLHLNSQYVISIFAEEYEKPMYEAMLEKVVMNGYVPPSQDLPFVNKMKQKVKALVKIFYHGDELTELDRQLEKLYLKLKNEKSNKYKQRAVDRFKTRYFPSDISRSQGQEEYRMCEMEYFFKPKPIYLEYQWQRGVKGESAVYGIDASKKQKKGIFGIFSQRRHEEAETRKRADYLLSRIFQYIECYEFVHHLNMPEDFIRLQSAANIHLWLLEQRLRHFSVRGGVDKLAKCGRAEISR